MTVDLALAALVAGFARYGTSCTRAQPGNPHAEWSAHRCWPMYCILCLAPLVRETGALLVLGWCAWNVAHLRWRTAAAGVTCAVPALAWWVYVSHHTMRDGTAWIARYPFSGLIDRTLAGDSTPRLTAWLRAAGATENLALAGIWLALASGLVFAWRKRFGLIETTALVFAGFVSMVGKYDVWDSAYAAGAMAGIRVRQLVYIGPMLLVLPRIALQFQAQMTAAFRAAYPNG
jgi:hypothetical protein